MSSRLHQVTGPLLGLVPDPQNGQLVGLYDLVHPANLRYARTIPVPPPAVPCMAYVRGEPCEQPSSVGLLRVGTISALYLCPSCYQAMR